MRLDILAWAERFVATPSVSRQGNRQIASLAAELLREIGIEARLERTVVEGTDQFNVIADVGPEPDFGQPRGLLLLTHLDTVPPGDAAAWTETGGDPFRPTRRGDRLYGLGSADAKLDFVCKAAALAEIDPTRLRRPVRIVGTFCEEIGLLGARQLVASGETRGFGYALVGEPSELAAIRAHKGYAVFEARIPLRPLADPGPLSTSESRHEGVSAHSSTPALGQNAIELALERLAAADAVGLAAFEGGGSVNMVPDRCALSVGARDRRGRDAATLFEKEPVLAFHLAWRRLLALLAEAKNPDFDPDHTVGNLGRAHLHGGQIRFTFDLRPIPEIDPLEAVTALEEFAEVECMRANPPLATARDSALIEALTRSQQAVGIEPQVATKATCTEAGVIDGAGLEAVILGAGRSVGNVHRPNEHTLIPQLAQARDLYRETIRALCGEEPPCSS